VGWVFPVGARCIEIDGVRVLEGEELTQVMIPTLCKLRVDIQYFPILHLPHAAIDVKRGGQVVAEAA
jgi:hypothetical protein